ncbi:MAG: hypothetical protein KAJ06_02235 [Gammaproteobacteria bacterium]|nr:hypothetical protein [Gammaproteobacteria bacterium]
MLERRNKGQRRWDLDTGFPLKDCNGTTIITERRRMSDRRLDNTSLEERLTMFSEMPPFDPERKKNH